MADFALPIRGSTSEGQEVTLREISLGHLTQLAGWDDFMALATEQLGNLGLGLSEDYRLAWRQNDAVAWRIAPDKILIRSDRPLTISSTPDLVALNLSQAKIRLHLEGPGAFGLLSRLAAIDFSETSFPVGTFAQTGVHHISVLIDRVGQHEFEVLVPTTWGSSLIEIMNVHLH
jgi:heterotetrameric sarcosine oxidase gamma subunit